MKLTIGQIGGMIVGFLAIISIILMYFAMINGNIEKGTRIFVESLTPLWVTFLESSSTIIIIITLLIILFWDKIKDIQFSI